MRILHVLDHSLPLHSGYSFRTQGILSAQRARGWETVQVTSAKQKGCTEPEQRIDGWLYHRSPPLGSLVARVPVVNQWGIVRSLERRLSTLVPECRPDIVHAHSPALTGVAVARVARRFGVPFLYECRAFWEDAAVDHGTTTEGSLRYRLTRDLETWVCRRAGAITTICEGIRGDLAERGLPGENITVIPNAVDLAEFDAAEDTRPAELAARLGLAGRTIIGFIGSFYAYEGLDLALAALPAIAARIPDAVLLLVGGGPQEEALRTRARDSGLDGRVVFAGRVPHAEVARYYDLVDLLVYPRRSMRLTELVTPLKPLEAMARRRLFVASDVGGHRELIEDGVTGTLFRAGDAAALADAVVRVLSDAAGRSARLAAARAFVERERTWPASVARYEGVYERLLATRH